ncbi:hypothetical protein [Hyphomicrobium sp. 99]|uniref:hypothetical protein n=1 Tax=Hyphomicrobium sp. 99 TaxID=1163419 RepID=UPI0005F87FFD|nr:hypothetical protein [Hyphomicrobium sp. 99]
MSALLRHPAFVLAVCGALSALLGSQIVGGNYGAAPQPGLYLVLTGLWFGLVVGLGVWRFGNVSPGSAITVILTTWVAWEAAVNVAIQIDGPLFEATGPSFLKSYFAGFVAGLVGAGITWAGAAVYVPSLRTKLACASLVVTGALLGLLLPATNYYDGGVVLLLPWQVTVAGLLGFNMVSSDCRRLRSHEALTSGS